MDLNELKKIINNLNNYSKKPKIQYKKISLNEVVELSINITNNFIQQSTDNFSVKYSDGFPIVFGNANRLEQVVINLINNSCQSLRNKDEKISIKVYEEYDSAIIEITDQGEGIEEKDLKHIFDPFYTTKRDKGGTGLGLSISYNIVKNHNGDFKIESEKGKGTTAKIYLPIYISDK